MKPLAIQFATCRKPIGWTNSVALLLGIVSLSTSVWVYGMARAELERLEADIRDAGANVERRSAIPSVRPSVTIPDAQVDAINAAVGQLNLPWAALFQVFEAAKPDTVALIALEPDGKKRTVVVQAESKTPEQMIAFAERLKLLPMFEEAFLTKHEIRELDPNRPYRFTLELRWREDV